MITKVLFYLFGALLISPSFVGAVTPTPKATPTAVDSYTLFWPVVAGTIKGQPLYPLKQLKEAVREFLIFSEYRKAAYNITLSVKRVVEAEKLFLELKDYKNAAGSLDEAQAKREKTVMLIRKVEGQGKNVTDLKNTLASSLEKQKMLLSDIRTKIPDEQKGVISQDLDKIQTILSGLQ